MHITGMGTRTADMTIQIIPTGLISTKTAIGTVIILITIITLIMITRPPNILITAIPTTKTAITISPL